MYHLIDNNIQNETVNFEIMKLEFMNNNYPIKHLVVLKIDNSEIDEIDFIKTNMNSFLYKNNILNILTLKILNDCNLNNEENLKKDNTENSFFTITDVIEELKKTNDVNYLINMSSKYNYNSIEKLINVKIDNKNILIQPIKDKDFYYCFYNKTLYSLENGSPGVSDLIKIYDVLNKDNEKEDTETNKDKVVNKELYNNIFAIKRSGDYLQIDYCKKNDYIFVTTDAMSASFCFIENCEFIGPFGPYGLFIKKEKNEKEYCYDNIQYDLTIE